MTTPCPNCGSPVQPGEYRCPACDTLAPPPAHSASVFDLRAGEPRWRDETVVGAASIDDTTVLTAERESPPWAIPIRDSPMSPGAAERREPRKALVSVLAAVALLAGAVVIVAQLFTDGGRQLAEAPPTTVAGDEAVAAETDSTGEDDSTDAGSASSTTAASVEETTTTTTAPASTTAQSTEPTSAPSTTAAASSAASGTGSAARLPASFQGGWVAQLTSIPTSVDPARVGDAWRSARSFAAGAVVTRSDEWPSMQPGFWVIVDAGPFASAEDVRSFCASVGHADRDDCLPRQLAGRR